MATFEKPSEAAIGLALAAAIVSGNQEKHKELLALQMARGAIVKEDAPAFKHTLPIDLPCGARGKATEIRTCKSCGQRGLDVQLYQCQKFGGECTIFTTEFTDYRKQVAGEATVRSCTLCDLDGQRELPTVDAGAWRKARCSYMPRPDDWAGKYHGGTLFICGAGPSLASIDWSALPWRGAMTLAINNAGWMGPRHDLWFGTDDAGKFAPEIWRDRALIKFTMPQRLTNHLRERVGDDWRVLEETAGMMRNVHTIARAGDAFNSATYFTSNTLQLGRLNSAGDDLECKSTMLYALRLAIDLGFKTINLLGVDFEMKSDRQYAFDEVKPESGVITSNRTFEFVNHAFKELAPQIAKLGVRIWNCTPGSKLEAFPFRTYAEAVREATPARTESLEKIYAWPEQQKLAVVTCTADRLRAFELLSGYINQQKRAPDVWVVADSGRQKVGGLEGNRRVRHLQLPWSDDPWKSFQSGMVAGIDAALAEGATLIAFCEDDDFYSPAFLDRCGKPFSDGAVIWGDRQARKWNADAGRVSVKSYAGHAATAQTVMSADVARQFRDLIIDNPHNADLRIWDQVTGIKRLDHGLKLHASIKGLYPVALTWGHNPATLNEEWKDDFDGVELKKWLGAAAEPYLRWFDAIPQVG